MFEKILTNLFGVSVFSFYLCNTIPLQRLIFQQ